MVSSIFDQLLQSGPTTIVYNEQGEPKEFTFDYSFWSYDGYKTREDGYLEPDDPKYHDQKYVFEVVRI